MIFQKRGGGGEIWKFWKIYTPVDIYIYSEMSQAVLVPNQTQNPLKSQPENLEEAAQRNLASGQPVLSIRKRKNREKTRVLIPQVIRTRTGGLGCIGYR